MKRFGNLFTLFTWLVVSMYDQLVLQCCEIRGKKAANTGSLLTHFICLALSLLPMKRMEEYCIITRVERARQPSSLKGPPGISRAYLFVCVVRKHPGGVASMTRDRGYPDWLVLSALFRLLWAG